MYRTTGSNRIIDMERTRETKDTDTTGRVLVVDDDVDAAEAVVMLVRVCRCETRVAYEGRAAIQIACQWLPHVALIDLSMPRMGGCEVAEELRQRPETADISLIALTGWRGDDVEEDVSAAGFDCHLVKPTGLDDLRHILAHYVPCHLGRNPT
jgi:CheY-like chemotaxis protein